MLLYFQSCFSDARSILSQGLLIYYIWCIMLLLGGVPRSARELAGKGLELLFCWCGIQIFNYLYFLAFGDSYLNQAQQFVFVVAYALLRSRYPVSKRIVLGSAGWAAFILVVSISGFSFGAFSFFLPICFVVIVYTASIWFFLRYATEEFLLAPRYYVLTATAISVAGVIASANWKIDPGFNVYYLTLSTVLLALLLFIYYLFYYINQTYNRTCELMTQQSQMEAAQQLQALNQKNYEELQMLRHEIKNHDAYIRFLVGNKQYEELERFTSQGLSTALHTPQINCGNRLVDAAINHELTLASISGVQLKVNLAIPSHLPIPDAELFSLLNNLLNNGIEGSIASHVPNPTITFRMWQAGNYLFLHMENPVDSTIDPTERLRLRTTKSNRHLHGFGTKIIQRIVERYNGYVQYDIQDGNFISDLMLATTEE